MEEWEYEKESEKVKNPALKKKHIKTKERMMLTEREKKYNERNAKKKEKKR